MNERTAPIGTLRTAAPILPATPLVKICGLRSVAAALAVPSPIGRISEFDSAFFHQSENA